MWGPFVKRAFGGRYIGVFSAVSVMVMSFRSVATSSGAANYGSALMPSGFGATAPA